MRDGDRDEIDRDEVEGVGELSPFHHGYCMHKELSPRKSQNGSHTQTPRAWLGASWLQNTPREVTRKTSARRAPAKLMHATC